MLPREDANTDFTQIFINVFACNILTTYSLYSTNFLAIISLAYELRIDITPDMGSIKLFAVVDLGFVFFYNFLRNLGWCSNVFLRDFLGSREIDEGKKENSTVSNKSKQESV